MSTNKQYISTTQVRCPGCGTTEVSTAMTNGRYSKVCTCGLTFDFLLGYVSPPMIEKPGHPEKQSNANIDIEEIDLSPDFTPEAIEALEICERILEKCGEMPERGEEFAASVEEKTVSISDWIESNGTVTDAQLSALENMESGLDAWLER